MGLIDGTFFDCNTFLNKACSFVSSTLLDRITGQNLSHRHNRKGELVYSFITITYWSKELILISATLQSQPTKDTRVFYVVSK